MRVVVVGATGHIGSYLVPRLVGAGHEVVAMSRGARRPYVDDAAWDQVEQVQVDRDAEDAAGVFGQRVADLRPDAVVDLICFTVPSARQLLEAVARAGAYLLHCGTIWVHGRAVEVPVNEDEARSPFGDYGTQKAAIEELLLGEARRGALRATVLHPGHIVGPGWMPLNPAGNFNPDVFNRVAKGEELALPHYGQETVHHVHADDVAQGFARALADPAAASGESFHMVSERAVTLRGYAESVAAWFGHPARLAFQPWETWAAAWDPEDAQATWEHVARSPSMSIDKASGSLGYRPRYSSLEAVLESLAWLVDHGQVSSPAGHQLRRDFYQA
jgi:nucleoside-diphosphate-sugar epimerase